MVIILFFDKAPFSILGIYKPSLDVTFDKATCSCP